MSNELEAALARVRELEARLKIARTEADLATEIIPELQRDIACLRAEMEAENARRSEALADVVTHAEQLLNHWPHITSQEMYGEGIRATLTATCFREWDRLHTRLREAIARSDTSALACRTEGWTRVHLDRLAHLQSVEEEHARLVADVLAEADQLDRLKSELRSTRELNARLMAEVEPLRRELAVTQRLTAKVAACRETALELAAQHVSVVDDRAAPQDCYNAGAVDALDFVPCPHCDAAKVGK